MYAGAETISSPAETAALRHAIWEFRDKTGCRWMDFARGTALSHNGVYYIATGRHQPSTITRDRLLRFMEGYLQDHPEQGVPRDTPGVRRSAPPVQFQMTRGARAVIAGIEHCVRRGLNGVVLGDPGTGKTAAVEYYSATTKHPHVLIYCRAYTTYTHLLRSMGRALGIAGNTCYELDEEIHRELAARPRLILLDEADMLGARTLDWLRSIWDGSGKQSIFFLTAKPAFYERMQIAHARSRAQDLRQLWRRIAFRKFIAGIDRGELDTALTERGVRDRFDEDAVAALHEAVGGSFGELEVYLANIAQIVEENPRLEGRITKKVVETAREVRFGVEFALGRRKV